MRKNQAKGELCANKRRYFPTTLFDTVTAGRYAQAYTCILGSLSAQAFYPSSYTGRSGFRLRSLLHSSSTRTPREFTRAPDQTVRGSLRVRTRRHLHKHWSTLMQQAYELTYVVFTDDEVAEEALTVLEKEGKVRKAARLSRGSKLPERSVLISHNRGQRGYVEVRRFGSSFAAFVRKSKSGKDAQARKAFVRIPSQVEKFFDPHSRYAIS